jgi:hypothetical protein
VNGLGLDFGGQEIVPAIMSGSTSSGHGPNYETDVKGQFRTHALQKRFGDLRLKARHAAPTAIGCPT